MNPFDHARSSARIHGGCWSDYHALHAWFDASKATHCHFTHRALRHHREGVIEAVELFGETIRNADGVEVPVAMLGRQHIEEDCGRLPNAAEWLIGFDRPDWMTGRSNDAEELARISALHFGGTVDAFLPIHRWFLATSNWAAGSEHVFFRHHAFGIYETEHRFGPALPVGERQVPTRVVAERHMRLVLNRMPAAADLFRRLKAERWMLQATSPARIGLD